MQRRYITVDVFTDRAFGGNQLAVVLDAGGLSTAQMQAIATEFNYSETTFVLPPRDKANDAEVRIFTPVQGACLCRPSQCRHRLRAGLDRRRSRSRACCSRRRPGSCRSRSCESRAGWSAPSSPRRSLWRGCRNCPPLKLRAASRSVRMTSRSTATRRRSSASETPFLVMELHSREALKRARPDAAAFGKVLAARRRPLGRGSTRAMCRAAEAPCDRQARMFMRGASGLAEDPATGSATVAAAALFAELDPTRDGELKLTVGQGFDMGRPSILRTRVRKQDGKIVSRPCRRAVACR